jgi:hypothetical protein
MVPGSGAGGGRPARARDVRPVLSLRPVGRMLNPPRATAVPSAYQTADALEPWVFRTTNTWKGHSGTPR